MMLPVEELDRIQQKHILSNVKLCKLIPISKIYKINFQKTI